MSKSKIIPNIKKIIKFLSFQSYLGSSMPSRDLPSRRETSDLNISVEENSDTRLKKDKKYITTIVIETDYYPQELEEGFASFFINISSNPNTVVLKKEIKPKTEAGDL